MAPRAQHPARRLREAAITFAAAVEAQDPHDVSVEWDRLRRAALNYREGPRPEGRPRERWTETASRWPKTDRNSATSEDAS
jgi:hypothetical protein